MRQSASMCVQHAGSYIQLHTITYIQLPLAFASKGDSWYGQIFEYSFEGGGPIIEDDFDPKSKHKNTNVGNCALTDSIPTLFHSQFYSIFVEKHLCRMLVLPKWVSAPSEKFWIRHYCYLSFNFNK